MKVLVVEDDLDMQEYLSDCLSCEGLEVTCTTGEDNVLESLKESQPDIVLLDYVLPGKTGIDIVSEIRKSEEFGQLPVVVLSGKSDKFTTVKALRSGADDFVYKPFEDQVLVARLEAAYRRANPVQQGKKKRYLIGNLEIDSLSHEVWIDGEKVPLTLTEFKILMELVQAHGKVLKREELRDVALGGVHVSDRTIDVHVSSLRKKISQCASSLQTIRGVGYRFYYSAGPLKRG